MRPIDADALTEDFTNDLINSRMEALRGNPHDSILISNVIERIQDAPTIEVEPVTWYTAEENQPDSVGDDVLIVDHDGKYHVAYYCSKGNWIDTNTGDPLGVAKWRYLDGDIDG